MRHFPNWHLRRILKAYASYYNEVRTHLSSAYSIIVGSNRWDRSSLEGAHGLIQSPLRPGSPHRADINAGRFGGRDHLRPHLPATGAS